MTLAGQMTALGMDGLAFLACDSDVDLLLAQEVARVARDDTLRANQIAHEVRKLFP